MEENNEVIDLILQKILTLNGFSQIEIIKKKKLLFLLILINKNINFNNQMIQNIIKKKLKLKSFDILKHFKP